MLSSMLPLWGQGSDSRGALGNGVAHPLSFPTPGFLYPSTQPSLPEGCSRSVKSLKEPSASGEQNAGETAGGQAAVPEAVRTESHHLVSRWPQRAL